MTWADRATDWARSAAAAAAIVATLGLGACTEVESKSEAGYQPAKLQSIPGNEERKQVTFTKEGAERVGLETDRVRSAGSQRVVPYEALLYAPDGGTFIYTSPRPRTFLRAEVKVDRIEGQRVLLASGPPVGASVVTTGAAEVHGTELEIAEK